MTNFSIVIPTYNRRNTLHRQLKALESLGAFDDDRIEVVVGNNASSDGTKELLLDLKNRLGKGFLAINYEAHVGSAEENVARLVHEASGEYVWLLSDDDVILRSSYGYLLELIATGRSECFVFDNASPSISMESRVDAETHTIGVFLPGQLSGRLAGGVIDYEEFMCQFGLTSYGALISRYVMRRELILDALDEYIKTAVIYSHVFAFLECLSDKRVEFVSVALIWRGESVVQDRFLALANRDWGCVYPWTKGLVDLARKYESRRGYELGWLSNVMELGADGVSYPLVEEVFNQLCRQVVLAAKHVSSRQIMSGLDYCVVSEYLVACGINRYYLRELSVVILELYVALRKRELYGVVDGDSDIFSRISRSVNSIWRQSYDAKRHGFKSSTFLKRLAIFLDNILFRIKVKNPTVYLIISRFLTKGIFVKLGVYRKLLWLKRLAAL